MSDSALRAGVPFSPRCNSRLPTAPKRSMNSFFGSQRALIMLSHIVLFRHADRAAVTLICLLNLGCASCTLLRRN